MRKVIPFVALAVALSVPACESFGQALGAHKNVVARAAGNELSVDEAASLLEENPQLPNQAQVVDALANLWVDYTVLAQAATKDTTLKSIDLQALVKPALEQDMVWQLRDRVVHPDTLISDAELQKLYDQESPAMQVRARHILLRLPPDATPAQRDSTMKLAERIRTDLVADSGKNFAELAKKYSQDPGSKDKGGELGFFSRGQMVAPFDQAAFALQPGQISNVVETPFGLHIIQVEERKNTPFAEAKDQFRQTTIRQRVQQAEQTYVQQLTDTMNITVADGAYDVVKDLAKKPEMKLSGRAAGRALVTYKGGALTAGEVMDLLRSLPAQQRSRFASAPDDQLKDVLTGLGKNEILVNEARRLGLSPTKQQQDSIMQIARTQLASVVKSTGLLAIKPQAGENESQAISRKVRALLSSVVKGQQNVIPLGPLAYELREQYSGQVYERSYPNVIAKVQAARPAAAPQLPGVVTPGSTPAGPATPATPAPAAPAGAASSAPAPGNVPATPAAPR
jgi:peptidyl-prolyl cis-trans isomerase C